MAHRRAGLNHSCHMYYYIEKLTGAESFDAVRDYLYAMLNAAHVDGVHDTEIGVYDEEIKGIHAPVRVLTAGLDGVWAASADEDGVHIDDLSDKINWPRETTSHRQSAPEAYRIARVVWPKLAGAKTMHEVSEILGTAGCRLHYYCAMD